MPKTSHNKEKPHEVKPYTRVTPRSVHRFSNFDAEDKNNLTNTTRDPQSYSQFLSLECSLKEFIIKLSRERGRKINILDSGCGQAVAIDDLLSDVELNNYIKSISGVSLHYFENVKSVMERHDSRFTYYLGTVQNVLTHAPETHNAFDLILDVWGAYPYSENKPGLLKQYHRALKPNGQALVYTEEFAAGVHIKNEAAGKHQFTLWAAQQYPETYSTKPRSNNSLVLSINKKSLRWNLPEYKIESSEEISSIGKKIPYEELKKGNAVLFSCVMVKPSPSQPMQLRPLKFNKKI